MTKWRTIVLSIQRDMEQDSKEDEIIFISDKSVLWPKTGLCMLTIWFIFSTAYFTFLLATGGEVTRN